MIKKTPFRHIEVEFFLANKKHVSKIERYVVFLGLCLKKAALYTDLNPR